MAANAQVPTFDQQIKEILSRVLLIDEEQLTPGARLRDDLGADSLDQVELAMYFEEELLGGNELKEEVIEAWVTVQNIIDSVTRAARKQ